MSRSARRPEAVYEVGLRVDDVDDDLVVSVDSLCRLGVHVVLAGFEDAASVINRFDPGGLVLADADRAFWVTAEGGGAPAWERQCDEPFGAWLVEHLWRLGIGPSLLAVHGDAVESLPTAVASLVSHLDDTGRRDGHDFARSLRQLSADRADGALPGVDESAGWCLTIEPDDGRPAQVLASLLTLSAGVIGVPGSLEDDPASDHFVLTAGAYGRGASGLIRPLPGPAVTVLDDPGRLRSSRRVLDLRTGVLRHEPIGVGLETVRFASLARPGVFTLHGEDKNFDTTWPTPLAPPTVTTDLAAEHTYTAVDGTAHRHARTTSETTTVTATATQREWRLSDRRRVERIASTRMLPVTAEADTDPTFEVASAEGFDRLLTEHRRVWAERWEAADIEIGGDPDSQLAVRYALFHLLSCAPTEGEAIVGARGLTGLAYAGHVFWDTDVFVLPTLAATLPSAARAMLQYRINRLDTAREAASARGLPGARFPWESAATGRDVTPTSTRDVEGHIVAIRTGEQEEHINADIAWALHHYLDWTGDNQVLDHGGRDLVLETARYWAARVRHDEDGRGHLFGVIGPDEYHETVDDNAYTNNLVRWHLRWAADLAEAAGNRDDAIRFDDVERTLVTGFDPVRGGHEQFAGFWDLEPLLIGDIADPPVAADVLLGRDRVHRAQIIKQPDVLMLHHLLPEACPPGSLRNDLDVYLPRTAHGSSLSPAICAALLARDGRPDDAMALFDIAAHLDLDDRTGVTAGGLHLATMGGLWQAIVTGFAGIRPTPAGLHIDPHLPRRWGHLSIRLHHHGRPIRITIDQEHVAIDADGPVPVVIDGRTFRAPTRVRYATDLEESR